MDKIEHRGCEEGVQWLWGGRVGAAQSIITHSTIRGDHVSRPFISCRHAHGHDMFGPRELPLTSLAAHVNFTLACLLKLNSR